MSDGRQAVKREDVNRVHCAREAVDRLRGRSQLGAAVFVSVDEVIGTSHGVGTEVADLELNADLTGVWMIGEWSAS